MERINIRSLFINENTISSSLMNFHVSFKLVPVKNKITTMLFVTENVHNELGLSFDNLEDAFNFTENVIDKSWSLDEVHKKYITDYVKVKNKTYDNP